MKVIVSQALINLVHSEPKLKVLRLMIDNPYVRITHQDAYKIYDFILRNEIVPGESYAEIGIYCELSINSGEQKNG